MKYSCQRPFPIFMLKSLAVSNNLLTFAALWVSATSIPTPTSVSDVLKQKNMINMRRFFILWCFALLAIVTVNAQQIAVVKGDVTSVYQTLAEAIDGAESGSFIYLPGGSFPISDEVKITKNLVIIGIGHNAESDNADGRTQIAGNLWFNEGSSGCAVMSCYINGDVIIGDGGAQVDNVLLRYCNMNGLQVKNSTCLGTTLDQNYVRKTATFNGAPGNVTNNIIHRILSLNGGCVSYNIITSNDTNTNGNLPSEALGASNAIIKNNVLFMEPGSGYGWSKSIHSGGNCQITNNMVKSNFGNNCIVIKVSWSEVFENNAGVSITSNYHFKEAYKEYEGKSGIYADKGFSDSALPPVPYIIEKEIPEQTDASGKLNIKIKVKAGE